MICHGLISMMKLLLLAAWWLPLTIPSCLDRHPEATVRAPAVFDKRQAGTSIGAKDFFKIYLRVADSTRYYDILWGIESQGHTTTFLPIELTPDKEYSFTITQERPSVQDSVVDRSFKLPHLVKVEEVYKRWDAPPLFDRTVCEVHHRKMQRKLVPVIYGMLGYLYTPEELKTLFPHHQEFVAGGCIVDERKTDKLFVCSECKAMYASWLKLNAHRAYAEK
jgi:hypothetical protein